MGLPLALPPTPGSGCSSMQPAPVGDNFKLLPTEPQVHKNARCALGILAGLLLASALNIIDASLKAPTLAKGEADVPYGSDAIARLALGSDPIPTTKARKLARHSLAQLERHSLARVRAHVGKQTADTMALQMASEPQPDVSNYRNNPRVVASEPLQHEPLRHSGGLKHALIHTAEELADRPYSSMVVSPKQALLRGLKGSGTTKYKAVASPW